MRVWFSAHRKLHLWLAADLALLVTFWALRAIRPAMDVLYAAADAVRRGVGSLCYRTDLSCMEILCAALAVLIPGYLLWNFAAVLRARGRRASRAYAAVLGAVCLGLTVYVGFCYLWGVTYYVPGFQQRSGVYAKDASVEELESVTRYFAHQLNQTAASVVRDSGGVFAQPQADIFAESVRVYDGAEKRFPFLTLADRPPKAVRFSRVMSLLDFTGVYCPYTGEANVNVDAPAALLPSTIAHELAHQRGVALEQECNFLSILACTTCGLSDYAYSGWLLGYIHLGNALYSADQERWRAVYDTLCPEVLADLAADSAYWAQFQNTPAKKVSNTVYEGFLKSYGESDGLQSYGTVVDLLIVWYADASAS